MSEEGREAFLAGNKEVTGGDHRSKSGTEEGLTPGDAVGWSGRWGRGVYSWAGVGEREEQDSAKFAP